MLRLKDMLVSAPSSPTRKSPAAEETKAEPPAAQNTGSRGSTSTGGSLSSTPHAPVERVNPPNVPNAAGSGPATAPPAKRKSRPQYSEEQGDFIWYCRDDLSLTWERVAKLFNEHWAFGDPESAREIPGLQSRYYRLLPESVRQRKKDHCGRPELGLLVKTDRRYWWMGALGTEDERRSARESSVYLESLESESSRDSPDLEDSDSEYEGDSPNPSNDSGAKGKHSQTSASSASYPSSHEDDEDDDDDDDEDDYYSLDYKNLHDRLYNKAAIEDVLRRRHPVYYLVGDRPRLTIIEALRTPRQSGSARVIKSIRKRRRSNADEPETNGAEKKPRSSHLGLGKPEPDEGVFVADNSPGDFEGNRRG